MRNLRAISIGVLMLPGLALAVDINVVGLFTNKAVVIIDGGKPRTLSVGDRTPEGVTLIAADSRAATFDVGGTRRTLAAGEGAAIQAAPAAGGGSATLTADARGHFITTGTINGISVRFMIDTGASVIALSSAEARRLGVNYLDGTRVLTQTANGLIPVFRVKLDTVRVGDITAHNVDAIVIEGDKLPLALLGMSFLNRMEMRRDGGTMTLIQRY
jgi:aspartyl protease family protein